MTRLTISSRWAATAMSRDSGAVLDLQRGQRAGGVVCAPLVPLKRGERLVRSGSSAAILQHVALAVGVHRDRPHRLADGDDRESGLPRDPLGGAVPGAGLLRRQARVGHELDSGRRIALAVGSSTIAPSILASSRSRVAENCAPSSKPPEQMAATTESQPSTMSAPVLPRTMRSRPSRSAVPGATTASAARRPLVSPVAHRKHLPNDPARLPTAAVS